MISFEHIVNIALHLDRFLASFIHTYGAWAYGVLFLIIFCETGLVIFPFLPGDTLLFAVGSLAARNILQIDYVIVLLIAAAILGDSTNYWIGRNTEHLLEKIKDRWYFKKAYLQKTHDFYEKYGVKTVILARFVPIVRTFAPFVAGIGMMPYRKFLSFSALGSVLWIGSLTATGYLFSQIPFVKQHFTVVVLAIVFISVLPGLIEVVRTKLKARKLNS
jgi:membrane-associated protein